MRPLKLLRDRAESRRSRATASNGDVDVCSNKEISWKVLLYLLFFISKEMQRSNEIAILRKFYLSARISKEYGNGAVDVSVEIKETP
jgi:hypothetical protein